MSTQRDTRPAKRQRSSSHDDKDNTIIKQWSVPAAVAEERSALISIFDKLGGHQWLRNDGWSTTKPISEWSGVRVDSSTGRVTVLELSKNNLAGRLDDVILDILRLVDLQQLWLSENQLRGPLPSWLVERTKLSILDVGTNLLTGALSPAFANSSRLTWFDYVGGNQLTYYWRGTLADNASSSSVSSSTSATSSQIVGLDVLALSKTVVHAHLWRVSTARSLISSDICARMIVAAEKHASAQSGGGGGDGDGWSQSRHREYSTTDVDVSLCPLLLELCNRILEQKIIPTLAALFGFEVSELGVEDMFVAKYDMLGQKELREHRDGSELSFVVALNDGFEGGGTNFIDMNAKTMKRKIVLVRPESVGDCVLFCGRHLHSGETITSGVRYILTGFVRVYVEDDDTGKKTMVEEIVRTGKK